MSLQPVRKLMHKQVRIACWNPLPEGLFVKVLACGDRLVLLAPQLISNETSNLTECYMSIQSCFDGGKQYNQIQKGSFEHRCYVAGRGFRIVSNGQLISGKKNNRREIRKGNYIMSKSKIISITCVFSCSIHVASTGIVYDHLFIGTQHLLHEVTGTA